MFDRTTWIAIAISIAGLIGFQWYNTKTYAPYYAQQAEIQRLAKLKAETEKLAKSPASSTVSVAQTPRILAQAVTLSPGRFDRCGSRSPGSHQGSSDLHLL